MLAKHRSTAFIWIEATPWIIITSRVPVHKSIWPTDEVIMMNNDETYDETYDEIMMKLEWKLL